MPERTNYLALSPSYKRVIEWCRRNRVKPGTVKIVLDMRDLRGVGDFYLIIFGGWQDGKEERLRQAGEYAMRRAKELFFAEIEKPITNAQGLIERWEKR